MVLSEIYFRQTSEDIKIAFKLAVPVFVIFVFVILNNNVDNIQLVFIADILKTVSEVRLQLNFLCKQIHRYSRTIALLIKMSIG